MKFEFLMQTAKVARLLQVCQDILPDIPAEHQPAFIAALMPFESCAVTTVWSQGDVPHSTGDLSPTEEREVLSRFVQRYQCSDVDWEALETLAEEVVRERKR